MKHGKRYFPCFQLAISNEQLAIEEFLTCHHAEFISASLRFKEIMKQSHKLPIFL